MVDKVDFSQHWFQAPTNVRFGPAKAEKLQNNIPHFLGGKAMSGSGISAIGPGHWCKYQGPVSGCV